MNDLNIRIMKKYLTIVMIIFASVVIGINLILSYIAVNNAFSVHINNAEWDLEIFSKDVKNKIEAAHRLGSQIYHDPDIEGAVNARNFDRSKLERRLEFYAASEYYIRSVHIYSSNTGVWYSAGNDVKINAVSEQMKEEVRTNKDNQNGFLTVEDGVPVYMFIIYPYARNDDVVVINYHMNYFNDYSISSKCAYMALNDEGRLLIKANNYRSASDDDIYELLQRKNKADGNVWFNSKYAVVRIKSDGKLFYSVTGIGDFLGRAMPTVMAALIGTLVMIVLVIFCFTSGMTWLLKKLSQYYWYAESARNEIKEKNSEAELKDYIIGNGGSVRGITTRINKNKGCAVFRLYIKDLEKNSMHENVGEKKAFNYAVRNVMTELLGGICAEVLKISPEDIVVLCNAEDSSTVYEKILETRMLIEEILHMKITVVKHRGSIDFSAVPAMYDKLVSAGDKSFFVGTDTVIDASDYDGMSYEADIGALSERVERAVTLGNAAEARGMLASENVINLSVYDAKNLASTIVKRLCTRSAVLSEQKHKAVEAAANEIYEYINGSCDWCGIVERLGNLFESVVELSRYNSEEYNREKYGQMIDIINEHYCDDGFSRDYMAQELKMSVKSMEQIFKRRENKSITNYIFEYRMAKAKELLDETDLPIKKIAEKVGYFNVSHFIQNFKKTYSITPDKYRKNR